MRVFKENEWVKGILDKSKTIFHKIERFKAYKIQCLKAVGALGLISAVVAGGNHYVQANMNEVFHVYIDHQEAGIVSNPKIVDQFVLDKYKQMALEDPQIHRVLNTDSVSFRSERAFKAVSDNATTLKRLDKMLTSKAIGVKLMVDGKLVAIVKDKDTARFILEQIKNQYVPMKESGGKVSILSVDQSTGKNAGSPVPDATLESVEIMQHIEMVTEEIKPSDIVQPEDVVRKLETGDVQPAKYIVREGDCVSCIAHKLHISMDMIYAKNPWIKDDFIDVGDELDLTVLQPTLSVKTVEKVWDEEEIEHDTIYQKDESMLAGQTKILKPGKNGLKKVAFQLVKVNGELQEEQFIDEIVMEKPVSALAIKGTKIILGVGSGKIAWPVLGASISSSFGIRWGQLHAGVDLTSSNKSILAADNGKVIFAGKKNGYGNAIIIDHNNGYQTLYGHLSKISVKEGSVVEKGQKIGIMGSTGHSTGVHLHFEVHKAGTPQNPMKYLNK